MKFVLSIFGFVLRGLDLFTLKKKTQVDKVEKIRAREGILSQSFG